MKIIGRNDLGYVVSMTKDEVARIAGFWNMNQDFITAMNEIGVYQQGGVLRDGLLKEGVEIPVSESWRRLGELRHRETEVHRAAQSLRVLADLMDGALPSVVAPAAEPQDPAP